MSYFIFFLLAIIFAINCIIIYFKNWEDERPDLGNFGGKNGTD